MTSTTRRAILGAIAGTPMLAISCAPQPAAATTAGPFSVLLAKYREAEAIDSAYWKEVEEPAGAAYRAAVDAIPHQSFSYTYGGHAGTGDSFSTAEPSDVAAAKRFVEGPERLREHDPINDELFEARRQLIEADKARAAERIRIKRDSGYEAIEDEGERLGDIRYALKWETIECPVTSAAELAAKIALINEDDCWDCKTAQSALVADAVALAKREGRS